MSKPLCPYPAGVDYISGFRKRNDLCINFKKIGMKIINFKSTCHLILVIVTVILFNSCDKSEFDSASLLGTWAREGKNKVWIQGNEIIYRGHYEYRLTFNSDSTFSGVDNTYGLYSEQEDSVLSVFHSYEGIYYTDSNGRIKMTKKRDIYWDSFFENPVNDTIIRESDLYPSCKFKIYGNKLVLNYFSDAGPEYINVNFVRQKN